MRKWAESKKNFPKAHNRRNPVFGQDSLLAVLTASVNPLIDVYRVPSCAALLPCLVGHLKAWRLKTGKVLPYGRTFVAYFRKPLMICSSASASVRPRVISLMICSPAILPMAASWISAESIWLASSWGMARIFA